MIYAVYVPLLTEDINRNLHKVLDAIAKAAEEHADILLFPETVLT